MLYIGELKGTITAARKFEKLEKYADELNTSLTKLQKVTQHLLSIAQQHGAEAFLADATLYLEFFGIVTIAWQWLLQGISAQKALNDGSRKEELNFYQGKMFALRYFYGYELPKTLGLTKRLLESDWPTIEMQTKHFND